MQEVDNAVNQAQKEMATRYDFRGSKSTLMLDKDKKIVKITADDDMKMKAVSDMVQMKMAKRGISLQALKIGKVDDALGGLKKCEITLVSGIETEKGKEIVKAIKESKIKVQAQIQDEQVRVSGKNRDDLQATITLVKGGDFKIPLQFENFRD